MKKHTGGTDVGMNYPSGVEKCQSTDHVADDEAALGDGEREQRPDWRQAETHHQPKSLDVWRPGEDETFVTDQVFMTEVHTLTYFVNVVNLMVPFGFDYPDTGSRSCRLVPY